MDQVTKQNSFRVHGEVVKPDGTPLPNLTVHALDRTLCEWRALGHGRTDDLGRYEIAYDPDQLAQWAKTRADLRVEVRDQSDDVVLVESPLILHARPDETVNLSIGTQRYRGPDEYTRLDRAVGQSLPASGSLSVPDVLILARQTKVASSKVAYYAKARRWSAQYGAPAPVFYGLLRRGEPTRIDALLARPLARLWNRLREAAERNLIDVPLTDATRDQLARVQRAYLARPGHPYPRLLATTELPVEQQAAFTRRLTAGEDSGDDLWQALVTDDGFSAGQVADLRAAFELQGLVGENTSLTVRLRGALGVRASREVAAFPVEQWRDTVLASAAVEIPDEVLPGGTAAERRGAYARMLYRTAEARYPTASLVGQMSRDPAWSTSAVLGFLTANPDVELRDQRVLTVLRESPHALDGLPATTRNDLLRVEQLFHLVPDEDRLATIQPLWAAGLRSAPQIAYLGRAGLSRRAGPGLDARSARRVHRAAIHVTSMALTVYLRHSPSLNGLPLTALRPSTVAADDALARAAVTMPEWEELFGSPDARECPPYASVLSPAAYLVDMMAYLDRAVDAAGNSALDELLTRRPDLGALRLTEANTDTALPYIDVVNEALEAIVASTDGKTLIGTAIGETTWDNTLLTAQPEHLKRAAYDVVRDARYPFDRLPFDLWAEEGRRYLAQMGIGRAELMRALPRRSGVDELAIATETLGMTGPERDLVCQPRPAPARLAPSWGYPHPAGLTAAKLAVVANLLDRAHLDYDRLLRLLDTRFLNPDRQLSVRFDSETASLDLAVLVDGDGNQLADEALWTFLDRLHRYLRLQRRLGCSEYDLDTLVAALGMADFDPPNAMTKFADARTLRDDLGLPLPELGAWWSDLDTYAFTGGAPAQYEMIFLADSLFPGSTGPDLRTQVFALRPDRADLAVTVSTDPDLSPWLAESNGAVPATYTPRPEYAGYVQSATRLTAEDLLLLIGGLLPKDAGTGHVALNLANLSTLYRTASMARALSVTVADALRLVALTGVHPAGGPDRTQRFRELLEEINTTGYPIQNLAYLLLHEPAAVAALAPTAGDATAWLASVGPGFAGVLAVDDERITLDVESTLATSLGTALGIDPDALSALLFTHRPALGMELLAHVIVAGNTGATGLPTPHGDFTVLFGQLHKFGLAWTGLALDREFLAFVLDAGPALGWIDLADLPTAPPRTVPFAAWRRLVAAAGLQASTFTVERSLFAVLEDATADASVTDEFLARISTDTGWPLAELTYLAGPDGFGYDLPAAFRDESALVELARAVDLVRPTGVAAQQAHAWAGAELTYDDAQSARQALSLAYAPDRWLEVLRTVQDELRTLRRDALLGQVLTSVDLPDSAAFYAYYLLDPDEAPTDQTSRIVLAHSTVLLFAQRILLNLEPYTFALADAQAWQWRKRYRVWEAARKVLLWPENWLEPELRDDKSPLFRTLEEGLLQTDVTADAAEQLYLAYLHDLHEVSQLEVMGLYCEEETTEQPAVLHVFGRTADVPHRYFYRRREDGSRWTAWEPVELDIAADHLVPVVSNGRLYLFWPEFTQSDNPDRESTETVQVEVDPERCDAIRAEIADHQDRIAEIDELLDMGAPNLEVKSNLDEERAEHVAAIAALGAELNSLIEDRATTVLGDRYLMKVGMRWSEYRDGRWLVATATQDTLSYTTSDRLARHYFTGWVDTDNVLRISVRINKVGTGQGVDTPRSAEGFIGYCYFDECGGDLVVSSSPVTDPVGDIGVVDGLPDYHAAQWLSDVDSLELLVDDESESRRLLSGHGHLYYAHQYGQYGDAASPFFYSDGVRTYLVEPIEYLAAATKFHTVNGNGNRNGARTTAGRSAVGSSALVSDHYSSYDTDVLIDRSGTLGTVGTLSDTIGGLIQADPDPMIIAGSGTIESLTCTQYRFTGFYHPHSCLFLEQAERYGVDGLLDPDPDQGPTFADLYRQLLPSKKFSFDKTYDPDPVWVADSSGSEQLGELIEFDHWSPYGLYNWELFFHIPLLVATRLMQNQRYADARRWFHYIFDPTCTDGTGPERFWQIKPFYLEQLGGPLDSIEALLTAGDTGFEQQVQEWERDPYNPHALARLRISAYMRAVVMRYLTCLILEADQLFGYDTREDVDQARQMYLLAAEILGDRPVLVPAGDESIPTPNILLGRLRLDWPSLPGAHPLDPLISLLPAGLGGLPGRGAGLRAATGSVTVDELDLPGTDLIGIGMIGTGTVAPEPTSVTDSLLLFRLPPNEMLLGYWDTVEDRLFKIRHSMTLSGQVRQLALYAPPIDPALLVRAAAAGIPIESLLSGLATPQSHYRFDFLLRRAVELCGEVRSLGVGVLSALEKKDGEQLGRLRSTQEIALLTAVRAVKTQAVDEAGAGVAALTKSRESAQLRADYYGGLERISAGEQNSLDALATSRTYQELAEAKEMLANTASLLPNVSTTTSVSPSVSVSFGGANLGAAAQAGASGFRAQADAYTYDAGRYGTMAGYLRRAADWKFEADLARAEMATLDQQILAATIRRQLAETDLANHDRQLTQSREVEEFLRTKYTNQDLYGWLVSKVSAVHFQAYQTAYQLAVQAQGAFQRELGPDERGLVFIQPDNWDSRYSGLCAGDQLYQQLRQMETAYLGANRRELEITKHISLFQLDPAALLSLRQTGSCRFTIPELVYDLDYADHFYRRVKAVRVSIPCVVGPYTSISATLRLVDSYTRRSTDRSDPQQPERDAVPPAPAAIAVNNASQDGGAFELAFDDPRYLPFEGAGAVSGWQLDLPATIRPFRYDTISDVVIHLSYTARDAGPDFAAQVRAGLPAALADAPMTRLVSLRQDQPDAWNQLYTAADGQPRTCTVRLTKTNFPAFLDYEWTDSGDGTIEPRPITLAITRLTGYLRPRGVPPTYADDLRINHVAPVDRGLNMPSFDLTGVPGVLTGTRLTNDGWIDCQLAIDNLVDIDDWDDLYLTVDYEVGT